MLCLQQTSINCAHANLQVQAMINSSHTSENVEPNHGHSTVPLLQVSV